MPDDVGGQPFPDGEEPDSRDRGAADDEFASVVLDEDFVQAAEVHEPTAVERILAAAQSHTESELPRILEEGFGYARGDGEFDGEADGDDPESDGDEGRFDRSDYDAEYAEYIEYADYFESAESAEPAESPENAEYPDTGDRPDGVGPGAPGRFGALGGPGQAFGPFPPTGGFEAYGSGAPGHPGVPGFEAAYEHGSDHGYLRRAGGARGPRGGVPREYRGHGSWQRPVAWVLAVLMGIGVVALAFTAVYRGASGQRHDPVPPPATTGVEPSAEGAPGALPSVSADAGAPTASAESPPG